MAHSVWVRSVEADRRGEGALAETRRRRTSCSHRSEALANTWAGMFAGRLRPTALALLPLERPSLGGGAARRHDDCRLGDGTVRDLISPAEWPSQIGAAGGRTGSDGVGPTASSRPRRFEESTRTRRWFLTVGK